MKGLLSALFVSCFFALPVAAQEESWDFHTLPNQWKEPRIYHQPLDGETQAIFKERVSINTVKKQPDEQRLMLSPNRAYGYWLEERKKEQLDYDLFIYTERPMVTHIELRNLYSSYSPPKISWINEKLLYIEFWWGRILGAYIVFDAEKGAVMQAEAVHEGSIAFQQWQAKP